MSRHHGAVTADDALRVYIVMLDENLWSSFVTFDEDEADRAAQMLGDAFGLERVTTAIRGQDEMWMLETKIATWSADPRISKPPSEHA